MNEKTFIRLLCRKDRHSVAIPNPGTPRRNEIHEILRNEVSHKRVNRRNQANLSVDEGFSVTNDLKSSNALHSYYCMGNESFFLVGFLSVCVYLLVRTHTRKRRTTTVRITVPAPLDTRTRKQRLNDDDSNYDGRTKETHAKLPETTVQIWSADASLFWFRYEAQLQDRSKLIGHAPMLHDPFVFEPHYVDNVNAYLSTGRRSTHH